MKTEAEQRHYGAPEKPAEPKLRRVREKFFSEKKLQKKSFRGYALDFVYIFDF